MKKTSAVLLFLLLSLNLSGCSLLYPNWDTKQSPGTSQSASPSESASESPSETPSTPAKSVAKVQIDDSSSDATAGVIQVIAEVTNVAEDGGTCTLIVQAGTTTKKYSFKAESNINTTQCHPLEAPISGLPKGTALVSVQYDSATYSGISTAVSVVIP